MRLKAAITVILLTILSSPQTSRAQTIQPQNDPLFDSFKPSWSSPSLEPSSPLPSPAKSIPTEKEPWWNPLGENLSKTVVALAGFGLTAITYQAVQFEQKTKDKILKVEQETRDKILKVEQETRDKILNVELREPTLLKDKIKRNSIIILGLGGCGKTTVIGHLSKDLTVDPSLSTRNYERLHWSETNSGMESTHSYYIADHKGQNIGTLIKGLIEEQKIPYSPMTWGAINSLIFVVDVAKAQGRGTKSEAELQQEVRETWRDRVQENVRQWSPTALDMIFGFTTQNSLKYVCLFVNKMDLLLLEEKKEVERLYRGLVEDLDVRCPGLVLETIFGSGQTGEGFTQLATSLKKNSWSERP